MSETTPAELLSLRQSIDNIDAALVHLLAERFKFTQQVGVLNINQLAQALRPVYRDRGGGKGQHGYGQPCPQRARQCLGRDPRPGRGGG